MKHIFLNLKRFDIPLAYGGVNSIAEPAEWGGYIVSHTQDGLSQYEGEAEFAMYFPESHVIGAASAKRADSRLSIGCQSVFRADTAVGGNFGAFTGSRTANAMKALGVSSALIGHCEERNSLMGVLKEAGIAGKEASEAVCRILNQEIACARAAGLSVLYCVGETAEEQPRFEEVLKEQIEIGLSGFLGKDESGICIAYEPIWAIGPGKTPPDRAYIEKIAVYLKKITGGLPIVYGGGLKTDNAAMLASIPEIDGGLIALTRFSGEIGFYPDEYLEIIRTYMGH